MSQGKSENEAIGIVIGEFGNIEELREALESDKGSEEVGETHAFGREAGRSRFMEKKRGRAGPFGLGEIFI